MKEAKNTHGGPGRGGGRKFRPDRRRLRVVKVYLTVEELRQVLEMSTDRRREKLLGN